MTLIDRAAATAMAYVFGASVASPVAAAGEAPPVAASSAVEPPAAAPSKSDPFDPECLVHIDAVLRTLAVLVVPASPKRLADGFGFPAGSGPAFAPVELVRPGAKGVAA